MRGSADAARRRTRIAELGAGVDTVRLGEEVEHEHGDHCHEEDDEATHCVTTLSLASFWYSELGQADRYLD